MSKKIITSVLLSAGLLANSAPASASMKFYLFSPNGVSSIQNFNPELFPHLLHLMNDAPTPTPTPTPPPAPLPPAVSRLMVSYRNLFDQPYDALMRYYTRTFALNIQDAGGDYHAYILQGQQGLLDVANRMRVLSRMAEPVATFILSYVHGSGNEVIPSLIETYSRLLTQINTEIGRLRGILQGLTAPKPTQEDYFADRCIDTHLTD